MIRKFIGLEFESLRVSFGAGGKPGVKGIKKAVRIIMSKLTSILAK